MTDSEIHMSFVTLLQQAELPFTQKTSNSVTVHLYEYNDHKEDWTFYVYDHKLIMPPSDLDEWKTSRSPNFVCDINDAVQCIKNVLSTYKVFCVIDDIFIALEAYEPPPVKTQMFHIMKNSVMTYRSYRVENRDERTGYTSDTHRIYVTRGGSVSLHDAHEAVYAMSTALFNSPEIEEMKDKKLEEQLKIAKHFRRGSKLKAFGI